MDNNYYKILGISKDASNDDIKKSYRKLAMKWHPDRNTENRENSEKKFKEISLAYNVLSDTIEKRKYDMMQYSPYQANRDFTFGEADNLFQNIFSSNLNNRYYKQPTKKKKIGVFRLQN